MRRKEVVARKQIISVSAIAIMLAVIGIGPYRMKSELHSVEIRDKRIGLPVPKTDGVTLW